MMMVPGAACQTVTMTMASHAHFSLARMLVASGVMPSFSAMVGSEVENRKLKTYATISADITMGMKKIPRMPVRHLIFALSPRATAIPTMLTVIVQTMARKKVNRYGCSTVGSWKMLM